MDDPGLAWPAWKFGMKRDDLFTKLHDQYNTVPSAIQDREAFHHDVYEISHEASTADEFHRLMAARKEQRLHELNNSLELAAVEIIANPALIGTSQWQYALQLFREKSLDSIVRYFASYLPDDHPWHHTSDESSAESDASDSMVNSMHSSFFEDKPITHEPFSLPTAATTQLPPSPRSMTMYSDSSVDADHGKYVLNPLTPARTLSFSESESDRFGLKDSCPHLHDDTSQSSDAETAVSSVADLSELEARDFVAVDAAMLDGQTADEFPSQVPNESETPTPKPDMAATATSFFEAKLSPLSTHHRNSSPTRVYAVAHNEPRKSPRLRRRDISPAQKGRRRSPAGRVQKPLPDPLRSRPSGRRLMETG